MIRNRAKYISESECNRYYGTRESNDVGIKVRFIHPKRTISTLKGNGYSTDEEKKIYNDLLDDIQKHTRWYLDNLEFLPEFQVSWENYHDRDAQLKYQKQYYAKNPRK